MICSEYISDGGEEALTSRRTLTVPAANLLAEHRAVRPRRTIPSRGEGEWRAGIWSP